MESWQEALDDSNIETAWDLFIDRYRRLLVATIRRTLPEPDDVADVFAHVCQRLSADDLKLLRRFTERAESRASFSTWLVVVVRNQTIDWMRSRSGRRRVSIPGTLSPFQREIFQHVFCDRRSHVEAYEIMRARSASFMPFGAFLQEVAQTYRLVEASGEHGRNYLDRAPELTPRPLPHPQDSVLEADARSRLEEVLDSLPPDTRLAVQLFAVDGVAAGEVARALGWSSAKNVYNRVYRALRKLREALERQGIRSGDL